MSGHVFRRHGVLQLVVLLAVAPPLIYCVALLYFLEARLPWPGSWLVPVAMVGGVLGLVSAFILDRSRVSSLSQSVEPLVRYVLALLLFQYALNKLIPGQFLLYNRDFDLPVRDLPARRLAWHFLGYSGLYNAFISVVELVAGLLLCARRTVRAGVLLSLAALANIVVIDVAFGLRGALPIATTMACASGALAIVHLDWPTLQSLAWRGSERVPSASASLRGRVLWLATVTLVFGFPLYKNLATRRGLDGQVPPAGRWEVEECAPVPALGICPYAGGTRAAVLYIEIGQWGQLVTDSGRRNASFTFDKARGFLELRIAASNSRNEPELLLMGAVTAQDNVVTLDGRAAGGPPFKVRLRRTHPAPWPPARVF